MIDGPYETTTVYPPVIEKRERIVAAAIQHGATISSPPPARHDTILKAMILIMNIDHPISGEAQGFITSEGRFVNRAEAYAIAWRSKQITETTQGYPLLYSEDLW